MHASPCLFFVTVKLTLFQNQSLDMVSDDDDDSQLSSSSSTLSRSEVEGFPSCFMTF